jgi:hypothetical protein
LAGGGRLVDPITLDETGPVAEFQEELHSLGLIFFDWTVPEGQLLREPTDIQGVVETLTLSIPFNSMLLLIFYRNENKKNQ